MIMAYKLTNPSQLGLTIFLILVYGVFLVYKAFKRKERLEYLAYIAATFPFAYAWALGANSLISFFFLLLLWTIALCRDVITWYRGRITKKADFANPTVLYLAGVGTYLLFTVILSVSPLHSIGALNMSERQDVHVWGGAFGLPDLVGARANGENIGYLFGIELLATINLLLIVAPLLLDIKAAEQMVPFLGNLIIASIFTVPTVLIFYLWILQTGFLWVIGLLTGFVYLVILLLITRGKQRRRRG
ncbi:MAG: hypothetical protein ACTSWN_05630 [Promethearchaeota archaeon]